MNKWLYNCVFGKLAISHYNKGIVNIRVWIAKPSTNWPFSHMSIYWLFSSMVEYACARDAFRR